MKLKADKIKILNMTRMRELKDDKLDFITIIQSPDIFLPLIAFFIILIVAFIVNKIYFKKQ